MNRSRSRSRIVVNGRFLGRPITGVERAGVEILRVLDSLVASRDARIADLDWTVAVPRGTVPTYSPHSIPTVEIGRLAGHAWEQIELPWYCRRDALVSFCSTGPMFKRRALTFVHDAHVWLAPDSFSLAFRLAYKTILPTAIRFNAAWATVSGFSDKALQDLGVANRPADVLLPSSAGHVRDWDPALSTIDPGILPDVFVFALASRSPLKNYALTYRLAEALAPKGIGVVAAGMSNARVFQGKGPGRAPGSVVEVGRVSDHDIAFLMGRALAFVFPSLHEGFGLPPVEAMALGCPVVASDRSAMPEVLGDAAWLCPPDDVAAWTEAVTTLAADGALRARFIERGRARAGRYDWTRNAVAVMDRARML